MILTTEQCINQFRMYANSNKSLGNKEREYALNFAADFLEKYHQDCDKPIDKELKPCLDWETCPTYNSGYCAPDSCNNYRPEKLLNQNNKP